MRERVLITCSLLLNCLTALFPQKVQDNRILFRGVVISSSTRERLQGATININRERRTLSRDDGTFSFYAGNRDTIVFSMLGYKPEKLIVSDTLRAREFLAGIYLQSDTIEIGEVIIIPGLRNLKLEMMNPRIESDTKMENAKTNITIASYVGRTTPPKMGDPAINYEVLRTRQKIAAYEKGGIPSDQMAAISPFLLIPAAYLLLNGLPEPPVAPDPGLTRREIEDLDRLYWEMIRARK